MNHLSSALETRAGRSLPYHSWESGHGSYARLAMILSDPFLPAESDQKLVQFLLSKRCKVYSPDLLDPYRTASRPLRFADFVKDFLTFDRFIRSADATLPVLLVAGGLAALPAATAVAETSLSFKAIAFLAPYLPFRDKAFGGCLWFKRHVAVRADVDAMVADTPEFEQIKRSVRRDVFLSVDMTRKMRLGMLPHSAAHVRGTDVGVFAGEADPCFYKSDPALLSLFEAERITEKTYGRMRHFPLYERHAENALNDLSLFLDRV